MTDRLTPISQVESTTYVIFWKPLISCKKTPYRHYILNSSYALVAFIIFTTEIAGTYTNQEDEKVIDSRRFDGIVIRLSSDVVELELIWMPRSAAHTFF